MLRAPKSAAQEKMALAVTLLASMVGVLVSEVIPWINSTPESLEQLRARSDAELERELGRMIYQSTWK